MCNCNFYKQKLLSCYEELNFYKEKYDQYYPREANDSHSQLIIDLIYSRINSCININNSIKNILDIGSGYGDLLISLGNKHFPSAQLFAIESSEACKEFLIQNSVNILASTVDDDWEKTFENLADIVIMRHALEHLLDPKAALKKISACLSNNGLLYLEVPNSYMPLSPLNSYYFRVVHTSYFSPDSLARFAVEVGLKVLKIEEDCEGNLFLIAQRGGLNNVSIQYDTRLHDKQMQIIRNVYKKEMVNRFFYFPFRIANLILKAFKH